MQYHPHCWESGEHHGYPGHTCVSPNGHDSDHAWIRNDRIIDYFRGHSDD